MTSSIWVVQQAVAGEDVPAARAEGRAVHVRHAAAGFGHDQRAAGDVPRLEVAFPEPVHPAGRDVAEIDRRRPEAPHGARLADERAEQADDLVDPRRARRTESR